ncbi:TPA: cysteine-rich KTR domain-containing protein, partial [Escherichia coli]
MLCPVCGNKTRLKI